MAATLVRFHLRECPKSVVYVAPVKNGDSLHRRNVNACQTIFNYTDTFERMRRYLIRCIEERVESHAGHFGHLLYVCSTSYNSQKKRSRTHLNNKIFPCF
jgi:hypothetical protein